jgi:hypothetical protein
MLFFLDMAKRGEACHFGIFRESRARRRVPHPRFVRVGLGVMFEAFDAGWIEAVLRAGRFAFCDVQKRNLGRPPCFLGRAKNERWSLW